MHPRRRVLKWSCAVAALIVGAVFIVSAWWLVGYRFGANSNSKFICIERSTLHIFWGRNDFLEPRGWKVIQPIFFDSDTIPMFELWGWHAKLGRSEFRVGIPLWFPFAILIAAYHLLGRIDRRPKIGHCRCCGYDLTGNTSGRCPECGENLSVSANSTPISIPNAGVINATATREDDSGSLQ